MIEKLENLRKTRFESTKNCAEKKNSDHKDTNIDGE